MKTKLVAILGGDDWADASVDHIVVPRDMDMGFMRLCYRGWLEARNNEPEPKRGYLTFAQWMLKFREGCREAGDDDIEVIERNHGSAFPSPFPSEGEGKATKETHIEDCHTCQPAQDSQQREDGRKGAGVDG